MDDQDADEEQKKKERSEKIWATVTRFLCTFNR